jgi:hypothetical protein
MSRAWAPALLMAALSLAGCGAGSEPFSTLGADPNSFVSLSFPFASSSGFGAMIQFGDPSTSDAIGFTVGGATIEARSPAAGLIGDTTATSVTILHTPNYATRLFNLTTVTARLGDYVAFNQALGYGAPGVIVQFQVLVGGNPVCPASYLTSAARASLQALFGGTSPCLR